MPETHAIKQQAYLDALGIAHYISRADLPGAAPSRRVPVPRPAAAPATEARRATDERSAEASPAIERPALSVGLAPEAAPPAAAAPLEIARFSIAAVVAGRFLWLEEVPEGVIGREQVALIRAMARALGAAGSPEVSQFDWPLHNNRQLDQGEVAARAALGSFVLRRAQERACEAVILLGEACRARLGELEGGPPQVAVAATREMLAEPALKPRVWRALRPLRRAAS